LNPEHYLQIRQKAQTEIRNPEPSNDQEQVEQEIETSIGKDKSNRKSFCSNCNKKENHKETKPHKVNEYIDKHIKPALV